MSDSFTAQHELQRPLQGIRIVEYGLFHAGPGGNAILGDLGADVIKIETASGDPERYWIHVAGSDFSLNNGESIIFEASNRNKKGESHPINSFFTLYYSLSILGKTKLNVEPAPARDSSEIVPPKLSTNLWTMGSPSPLPSIPFVV